jgi:hypothetical protein
MVLSTSATGLLHLLCGVWGPFPLALAVKVAIPIQLKEIVFSV